MSTTLYVIGNVFRAPLRWLYERWVTIQIRTVCKTTHSSAPLLIATSKGIQVSHGSWNPRLGFWIPDFVTENWILNTNLQWDSRFFELYSGFQCPGFWIPHAKFSRIPDCTSKNFPWFRNPAVNWLGLKNIFLESSSKRRLVCLKIETTYETGWIGTFHFSSRTAPRPPCNLSCRHHWRLHSRGPKCCRRLKKRQGPPFTAYWRRGGGGREGRGARKKNGMPNFIFSPPPHFFFSIRSYIGRTRRIRFFKHKLKELFAVNSCRILLTGNVILYRFFKIRKRVLALP